MTNKSKIFTLSIALAITMIALVMVLVLRNVDADNTNVNITDAQAKTIALQDSGVAENEVTFTKCALEKEDGRSVYEIEFYTDDTEYVYLVESGSGSIYSKEKTLQTAKEKKEETVDDEEDDTVTASSDVSEKKSSSNSSTKKENKSKQSKQSADNSGNTDNNNDKNTDDATTYIGTEKAKSIALSDAGVSDARFEKAKLDHDDGRAVYEIEFKANGKEYEYEIDASSGRIIDRDIEDDDD